MVAIAEPRSPTRLALARQCVGSGSSARDKNPEPGTDRNGQYSAPGLTDGGGSIVERHAYTAYGQVTFADASGTVQAASESSKRYTYAGRDADQRGQSASKGSSLFDASKRRFEVAASTGSPFRIR